MEPSMTHLILKYGKEMNKGNALVISLILIAVVSIGIWSAATFSIHEKRLSHHSSAFAQAIQTAEAGVDLTIREFYKELYYQNGWQTPWIDSYTNKTLSYTSLDYNLSYAVTANTNSLYIISTGRVTSSSFYPIERTVKVYLSIGFSTFFGNGMTAKHGVTLQGSMTADSFDSTDPTKSTDGQYDVTKRQDNATVMSLDTNNPALNALQGTLYGDLLTLEDGTITYGTSFHHASGSTGITEYVDIPDVRVPFDTTINHPQINGTETITAPATISTPKIALNGTKVLTFTGSGLIRIYVDGETSFSGSSLMKIVPDPAGADLEIQLYCNNDVKLNSVLNDVGLAKNFSIYGTPNCSEIQYNGNDPFIGTIYAPNAKYIHNGNGDFHGSIVTEEVDYLGNANFHYDESLSDKELDFQDKFTIEKWTEL
jgi:hypothetical protein